MGLDVATKHEKIIQYIADTDIGQKISVRSVARQMGVSEGTAYRAIKSAEADGLVATVPRVGTIRVEKTIRGDIQNLTFGDIQQVIDGTLFGGEAGLSHRLDRFVIGAMTTEAMKDYVTPGALLIVGNREDAQLMALSTGAGVLITGGFNASPAVVAAADKAALPLLGSNYDSFTVATIINRAISDQQIKKEIVTVGDAYIPIAETAYLRQDETVSRYRQLAKAVKHSCFPIVARDMRVVGVISAKDVLSASGESTLERVMTKNPITVRKEMSAASVSHIMAWNSIELIPVVDPEFHLMGIVTRTDIMRNLPVPGHQSEGANTFFDVIHASLRPDNDDRRWQTVVSPQMTNSLGTIAVGILSEMITEVAQDYLKLNYQKRSLIEQVTVNYLKLIQLEHKVVIVPQLLDLGRRSAKLEITVTAEHVLSAKAFVVCQILEEE
jgi:predicted transcriptional regulator